MFRLFDYKCPVCDSRKEKLVRDIVLDAPECDNGHGQMEKTMGTPALKFKNGAGTDMGNSMSIAGYGLPRV